MKDRFHLTLLLCLFCPFVLFAQFHPKVGVVLSGGGAKGYAHVGALKVIEEAGIKVDYIGGTSMGAIVGGLYAAGWSATELDSLMRHFDIQELVADRTPRRLKLFFEKQYAEKYILSLSMEDFQISLPAGISNGQMLFGLFSDLTRRVQYIHDFNQLPIPFLCIVTEVATGQEIVLREGNLPQAMLASGAFPGLFAPVEIDGKMYTDGGLVNNFPVQEVIEMGADIIIGITVEEGLLDEESLQSVPSIISQISSYRQVERSREQYPFTDVLITPNVKGFGVTSFNAVDTLITNGEAAARQQWDALRDIAQQQRATARLTRRAVPRSPAIAGNMYVDKLVIKSPDSSLVAGLSSAMPSRLRGEVTPEQLKEVIEGYYATGHYKNIFYDFKKNEFGQRVLELEPQRKPGYNRQFRVGLHYDDVYKTSILFNATWLDALIPNSRASFDLIVGDRLRYDFHYLIEEENGQDLGFRSRSQFNDLNFVLPEPIMIDELMLEAIQYNFIDISNEVYVHLLRSRTAATGLSLEAKYFRNKTNQVATLSSFDPLAGSSGWYLTGKAFMRMDTRNDRHFPHRGVHMNAEARLIYNFSEEYNSTANKPFGLNLDLSFQAFSPLSARTTLGYYVEAGSNFRNSHVPYLYLLGSINENLINNFKPFPGLEFGQVFGAAIAGGGLETRYEPFHNHFFIVGGRWSYVRDFSDLANEVDRYVYGFYAGYRLRTALGPVGINYGHTNLGNEWDFFVGHWF